MDHPTQSTPPIVWLALAAAILCGIALRLAHHDDVPLINRSPDERIYTGRAQRLAGEGFSAMRPGFAEFVNTPALWIQTPVTRVGYVFAIAAIMKTTSAKDFNAGAALSLASSILSLFLIAWMGIRFFNPWIAVLGVTFFDFSVGALGMARRAWSDSFFGFLGLLLLCLTCEIMRNPRRVFLYPLFLLVGTFAMLTKETSVLSYGICGLWIFGLLLWKERSWKLATLLALGGLATVAIAVAVWAMLAGSVSIPMQALFHVKVDSAWARANTGGPWYQFAYLLWLVGPLTSLMALVGMAAVTLPASTRAKFRTLDLPPTMDSIPVARLSALIVVAFILFTSFVGHLQYLRMVSPSDGAYCLLAGLGLWTLLSMGQRYLSQTDFRILALLMVLAVAMEGVRDYRVYTHVVVRTGMQDLTALWIRASLGR